MRNSSRDTLLIVCTACCNRGPPQSPGRPDLMRHPMMHFSISSSRSQDFFMKGISQRCQPNYQCERVRISLESEQFIYISKGLLKCSCLGIESSSVPYNSEEVLFLNLFHFR